MTSTNTSKSGGQDVGRRARKSLRTRDFDRQAWRGPVRRYDILKEGTIAIAVVTVLVIVLAVLFSSPDVKSVTLQSWASAQPQGFVETALSELNSTSSTATYGPPYNNQSGSVQDLWGVSIQNAIGVTDSINPSQEFVLDPLSTVSGEPALTAALQRYNAAGASQQAAWLAAYGKALDKAKVQSGQLVVPQASDGPVPEMLTSFLAMARSGGLDAALVAHSSFYTTNYTNPIMFLGDSYTAHPNSSYVGQIVNAQHMAGSQWGVMNETGSWPGQPWLWLYSFWYQVNPMANSGNADIEVIAIMGVLTVLLALVPFIPGLRDIPRKIPVHRLIWKDYYRSNKPGGAPGADVTT